MKRKGIFSSASSALPRSANSPQCVIHNGNGGGGGCLYGLPHSVTADLASSLAGDGGGVGRA